MKDFKKKLTIKSLSKIFGGKKVLDNFNLTLEKGEFVTFLGPSGCGKSTALNCIAGLIPISGGEIHIDDECIDDSVKSVPAEKREFGMVFQSYALFPHLSVFNNVAFGLRLKKMPKDVIKEKVTNVLKMVHLEGYEDKYPGQMSGSGGEQQRVAIARCIVMEPRLLMLDEPLSNLDAKLRIDMRFEIKSLHSRLRMTSLYVTHDQQEALALSDRIVVMKKGVIQQIGTPAEIYSKPVNLFVAGFMGYKNMWPATITNIKEEGSTTEISIDVDGIPLVSKFISSGSCVYEEQKKALIKSFNAKEKVYTAIRPEDIQIGNSSVNKIAAQVSIVEYLGQLSQISALHANNTRIELRTDASAKEEDKIQIFFPPEKLLLFQREEG
jgi:putative spermidine/putrescine transport system ATP-binding protein